MLRRSNQYRGVSSSTTGALNFSRCGTQPEFHPKIRITRKSIASDLLHVNFPLQCGFSRFMGKLLD
jgi:hypothetical protein